MEQLLRHLPDGLLYALGGSRPFGAAELVYCRLLAFRADVLLHAIDLVRGHVELIGAGILQQQVVFVSSGTRQFRKPAAAANAMVYVDDVITF